MKFLVLAITCWLACAPVRAQEAQEVPVAGESSIAAAQQRLEQRRSALQDDHDARETACAQTFAVNDCLTRVQAQHRSEMTELRRQEAIIHDSLRLQRSQDELRLVEDRLQQHGSQGPQGPQGAQDVPPETDGKDLRAVPPLLSPTSPISPSAHLPAKPAAERTAPSVARGPDAAQRAENRAAYLQKRDAVRQHKDDVRKRLQESGQKPDLPLPGSAPATAPAPVPVPVPVPVPAQEVHLNDRH